VDTAFFYVKKWKKCKNVDKSTKEGMMVSDTSLGGFYV